jgi:hypothetical protein
MIYQIDSAFDQMTCDGTVGGYCTLPNSCSTYTGIWSSGYTFKVKFAGNENYMVIPLAAITYDTSLYNTCDIYLQFLDN